MAHKDFATLFADKISVARSQLYIFMQRSRDDWYWKQYMYNKKRARLVKAQKLDYQSHLDHGPNLATAKFVIQRCYGKVQDETGTWFEKMRNLPFNCGESFKVVAIDASRTRLTMEGTDNFADLEHLRSLNLSYNNYLDDFACDQIARQFRKSKTLESIDLSHCNQISIHGLNVLFRIPSLRQIRAINTAAARHEQADLFVISAEDERGCRVIIDEDQQLPEEQKYLE